VPINKNVLNFSTQNELKNLEDAGVEIMLLGDDEKIPICIGECFVRFSQDEAMVSSTWYKYASHSTKVTN